MYGVLYYRRKRLKIDNVYKEWQGYFTTKEQLHRYINKDKISCLFCGKEFEALNFHVLFKHKMPVSEYKTLFGIPLKYGLVGRRLKKKRVKHGKTKDKDFLAKIAKEGRLLKTKNPPRGKREYNSISAQAIAKNARKGGRTEDILKNKVEANCHKCGDKVIYSKHGMKILEARGFSPTCYICRWKLKNKKAGLKKKKNNQKY